MSHLTHRIVSFVVSFLPFLVNFLVDVEFDTIVTSSDCLYIKINIFIELDLLDVIHVDDGEKVDPDADATNHKTKSLSLEDIWELTSLSFWWSWNLHFSDDARGLNVKVGSRVNTLIWHLGVAWSLLIQGPSIGLSAKINLATNLLVWIDGSVFITFLQLVIDEFMIHVFGASFGIAS